MAEINNVKQKTLGEAEKLLTAECGKEVNDEVFDIYGNYSYPFEQKLSTPNTAYGAVGTEY